MPFAASGLSQLITNWKMSFPSVHFLLFLPLVLGGSFVLPPRFRRAFLLLASYYFYFFAAPKYLPLLIIVSLLTYLFGILTGRAKTPKQSRICAGMATAVLIILLCFFKYNTFFAPVFSPVFARLGIAYSAGYFTTAAALGISFYTFSAIAYLVDVARGDYPAEKNILTFALFLGFFPSVTMGPISRAGQLIPQLKNLTRQNLQNTTDALLGMAIGYFKKLAVADTLAIFTGQVYADLNSYSGLTLMLAAFCFALQLYFDFSGYSDIAINTAKLFGIKLPENFKNPYFATNFSAFWARWHISLSAFLQDYIFTPIVWSRYTQKLPFIGKRIAKPPVLSAIAVTFLVSGIWHGDTILFLVWGALMAVYRIGEEILHRTLGKPKKNPKLPVRIGKTAVIFILWVEGLVLFKVGMQVNAADGLPLTIGDALSALGRQFTGVSLSGTTRDVFEAVKAGFYQDGRIALGFIIFTIICLSLAVYADWAQFFKLKGAPLAQGIKTLTRPRRWVIYYVLILACFSGFIAVSGGFGGSSFLYGGF